ncbi:MAG: TIGR03619 family F420-dependent LLM class oxidoreductase [Thaumarchaeota archaeon]|nr:TIGR03619 family F420-dependent LLM class oxidoreductase [Nitrososphaerota archaeon]
MKFGLVLPNFGGRVKPTDLVDFALAAEQGGFDSVFVTDHIILPKDTETPYGELFEPLVTLAFLAAKTTSVRLGTSILVLPQRNPFLVAKQVAALDQFSKGRTILGVGAGWEAREFQYLSADFKMRGKILDESIQLIRALWTNDEIDFSGKFFNAKDAVFLPKPVQKLVPIWIGGTSDAAVNRAAKLGDGWHPNGITPSQLAFGIHRIRKSGRKVLITMRITTDLMRKRDDVVLPNGEKRKILSGTRGEIVAQLDEYKIAGLEYSCVYFYHDDTSQIITDVKKFAADIVRSYS